jgi:ABC-type glycerol-3-phosphate transport system permease component
MMSLALPLRRRVKHPWSYSVLLIICLLSLFPFIYLITASLRGASGNAWSFELWRDLFRQIDVVRYMLNSALFGLVVTALVLLVTSLAGFGFAKLSYPGSTPLLFVVGACLLVPLPTIILPEYINVSNAGLLSGFLGATLVFVGTSIPFATILMTSYFRSLPDSIMESALLDGASYIRTCRSIYLPMAVPAIATVGALQFVLVWNNLLIALLFLPNTNDWTIGVALATISGNHEANANVLLTGSLVSAIPAVLVYVYFQKYIIAGVTSGITN